MADLNLSISIVTLNINGLHTPIVKQRLSNKIFLKKQSPTTCNPQEMYFNIKT